jgi:hypothetical protein
MLALFSGSSFPFHLPGDDQEEEGEEEEEEEEDADSDDNDDDDDDDDEEEEGHSDDDDELDQDSDNEPDGGGELRLRYASMASSQDEEEDDSDDGGIVFGPTPPAQFQNPSATLTAAQLQADRGMSLENQDGCGDAGLEDRPEGTGWGRQLKRPRTVTPSASASLESSKGKNVSDEPADAKKVCV